MPPPDVARAQLARSPVGAVLGGAPGGGGRGDVDGVAVLRGVVGGIPGAHGEGVNGAGPQPGQPGRGQGAADAVDAGALLIDVVRRHTHVVPGAGPGQDGRAGTVGTPREVRRSGGRALVGRGRGRGGDGGGSTGGRQVPGGVPGTDGEAVRGRGGEPVDVDHAPVGRDLLDHGPVAQDLVPGDGPVVGRRLPHDVYGRGTARLRGDRAGHGRAPPVLVVPSPACGEQQGQGDEQADGSPGPAAGPAAGSAAHGGASRPTEKVQTCMTR